MSTLDEATVKVFRFDPTVDKEPRYETYKVPPEVWKGRKITDVLRYIYENLAPGLSFREHCYHHKCGACTIMVNNKPTLACGTLAEKEMLIEPFNTRRLIKDLTVEF